MLLSTDGRWQSIIFGYHKFIYLLKKNKINKFGFKGVKKYRYLKYFETWTRIIIWNHTTYVRDLFSRDPIHVAKLMVNHICLQSFY